MKILSHAFLCLVLLAGCAPVSKVTLPSAPPPAPPPVVQPPLFEKTFGDISIGKSVSLLIRYKTIAVLVDPDYDVPVASAVSPQLDYLFLTDASSRHFNAAAQSALRKNLKIIASPEESEKVKKAGFTDVKGLAAGQRILLKKNDDFVFVSAVQSRNQASGLQVNSYLLEFDNGRNLFVSGEISGADALRELVYSLRDDGKQVYAGFFSAIPSNDAVTAQIISLIQPKNAVLFYSDGKLNEAALRDALKAELFEGPFVILKEGVSIPF